jgi:hyperosmotically inducible periplasmic protein
MVRFAVTWLIVVIFTSLTACQSMNGKTAGRKIDDGTIAAQIKSQLAADTGVSVTRLDVDTNNATVYLNGTVATPDLKMRAEQVARQVEGVERVINNLEVEPK